MKERPGAAVINVASISGCAARDVGPIRRGQGVADFRYRAVGARIRAFIRVNTVSPGSILVEGNGWDAEQMSVAIGVACSQAGGLLEFVTDPSKA